MSVVSSAVDTVMVSWAEAPNELRSNYPHLSDQMVRAWRKTYPQEFVYAFAVPIEDDEAIYTAQQQSVPLVPPPTSAGDITVVAANKSDPLAPPEN